MTCGKLTRRSANFLRERVEFARQSLSVPEGPAKTQLLKETACFDGSKYSTDEAS